MVNGLKKVRRVNFTTLNFSPYSPYANIRDSKTQSTSKRFKLALENILDINLNKLCNDALCPLVFWCLCG